MCSTLGTQKNSRNHTHAHTKTFMEKNINRRNVSDNAKGLECCLMSPHTLCCTDMVTYGRDIRIRGKFFKIHTTLLHNRSPCYMAHNNSSSYFIIWTRILVYKKKHNSVKVLMGRSILFFRFSSHGVRD